jgi:hypothetical protein
MVWRLPDRTHSQAETNRHASLDHGFRKYPVKTRPHHPNARRILWTIETWKVDDSLDVPILVAVDDL